MEPESTLKLFKMAISAPPYGRFVLRERLHGRRAAADAARQGVRRQRQPAPVQGLLLHQPELRRVLMALAGVAVVF